MVEQPERATACRKESMNFGQPGWASYIPGASVTHCCLCLDEYALCSLIDVLMLMLLVSISQPSSVFRMS